MSPLFLTGPHVETGTDPILGDKARGGPGPWPSPLGLRGQRVTPGTLPADVNECEAQRCSQECANIYGSYQCYCRQGYQLAEDGHTCTGTAPLPGAPS